MQDAIREVLDFVDGRTREDLNSNRMLMLALVKEIEIIGEAANVLTDEARSLAPEVPWVDVIGMRHRLVHAHDDINLDVLWRTCTRDVVLLHPVVDRLLAELEATTE